MSKKASKPSQEEGSASFFGAIQKVSQAGKIVTDATLPADPKSMSHEEKNEAINSYVEELTEGDASLVDSIRELLAAKRAERKEGLKAWAVELSDTDFPIAVDAHDVSEKRKDQAMLDQIETALRDAREEAGRVARAHRNEH